MERCSHATDRRARVVHLTGAGRQLAESAFAGHSAAMERATAGLTPDERAQAAALLRKLGRYAAALDSLTPAPPEPVLPSMK